MLCAWADTAEWVVVAFTRPPAPVDGALIATKLGQLSGQPFEMLVRFLKMIQVQRQDFNGRVLTIRRDDLRAIACILDTTPDDAIARLESLGLCLV